MGSTESVEIWPPFRNFASLSIKVGLRMFCSVSFHPVTVTTKYLLISSSSLSEEHLDLDHSQWEDIHVVTGALKMFFRELPEPLFPFKSFPLFVDAISKSN